MNMLLVGVEEVSSCGLVRQQLVHARLFRAEFHSQLAYPQELIRAAIAVAYKSQVCLRLAGSLKSFDISICSCFREFLCFYTACIGDELCLWRFWTCSPDACQTSTTGHSEVFETNTARSADLRVYHHTWPRIQAALYTCVTYDRHHATSRQSRIVLVCKVWPYAHNATTCF